MTANNVPDSIFPVTENSNIWFLIITFELIWAPQFRADMLIICVKILM